MVIDILDGIGKIINKDKLSKLDFDWASDIAYLSRGLNKSEILAYYGITEEVADEDKKFIELIITRGKTQANAEATKHLFESMRESRTAATSSLSYLTRFADDWAKDTAVDSGQEKFVFVMKEPK